MRLGLRCSFLGGPFGPVAPNAARSASHVALLPVASLRLRDRSQPLAAPFRFVVVASLLPLATRALFSRSRSRTIPCSAQRTSHARARLGCSARFEEIRGEQRAIGMWLRAREVAVRRAA